MGVKLKVPEITPSIEPNTDIVLKSNIESYSNTTKDNKMSIKTLVGKKQTKTVKFMNEDVKISKLSVAQVLEIQNKAKAIEADESKGFDVLKIVIMSAVEDGDTLSDEDFDSFPMDELSKLSAEIMKFSGLTEAGK